jgi:hypothetical protein
MSPLEWVVIFLSVIFVLTRIRIRVIKKEEPKEQGGELIEHEYLNSIKPPIICNTELIDNQIYVWNKETETFMIQGKSMEDIVKYFTQNFPGRKIVLVEKK